MSFITRASRIAELPRPLAICCHDAGAANLIAAWLAAEPPVDVRLCAEGPSRAIFARILPALVPLPLDAALERAGCLLSGTGWASELEHEARIRAAERGLPSVAVLDHWVNYAERFTRRERTQLPDVFVVADAEAGAIARGLFGSERPVLVWRNQYLDGEAARVRALRPAVPVDGPRRLLVVLEPVRNDWQPGATEPAEFRALDYLVSRLPNLGASSDLRIRMRAHPSEHPEKYSDWQRRQCAVALEWSTGRDLAEDIAWADAVAGLQSYALVVALAAGRRAWSYLPPGAPACSLHAPGLELLREHRVSGT